MGEAMTDLEITKLCAEAMGVFGHPTRESGMMWTPEGWELHKDALIAHAGKWKIWNPLHDDAQAMALKKKFRLSDRYFQDEGMWGVPIDGGGGWSMSLNRAICECVARMQQAKVSA